jgi:Protein of unknown function (DUF1569)
MKTVFNESLRQDLLARIGRITPESKPRWGKMNAEQMLAHLVEAMKLGTGELKVKSKNLFWRKPPFRQLIIYLLPWPKGAPTVPELVRRESDAGTIERSRAELARLVNDVAGRAKQTEWPEHPAFGNLGRRGWGVLAWRHVDHHLRQFGV